MTYASGVLGGPGVPARCPAVGSSGCAGERLGAPLEEVAGGLGPRLRAAAWGPAQGRAVRPGTPCSALTVLTSAQEAVPSSGTECSVCREHAVQAVAVLPANWSRMGIVYLSPPAAVAPLAPMPHGCWPPLRWCSWTAKTAPVSTGPWWPRHECPVLEPWSAGSSCSVPCGGGTTE